MQMAFSALAPLLPSTEVATSVSADPVSDYIKLLTAGLSDLLCEDDKVRYVTRRIAENIQNKVPIRGDYGRVNIHSIGLAVTKLDSVFWQKNLAEYRKNHPQSITDKMAADIESDRDFASGSSVYIGHAREWAQKHCKEQGLDFAEAVKKAIAEKGCEIISIPTDDEAMVDAPSGIVNGFVESLLDRNVSSLREQVRSELGAMYKESLLAALTDERKLSDLIMGTTRIFIERLYGGACDSLGAFARVYGGCNRLLEERPELATEVRKKLENSDVLNLFGKVDVVRNPCMKSEYVMVVNCADVSAQALHTILLKLFENDAKSGKLSINAPNDGAQRLFVSTSNDSDASLLLWSQVSQRERG